MKLWAQVYIVVAAFTLGWILYNLFVAWRDGHIRVTDGHDDEENKRFFWHIIATSVHGAIGAAAVWPLTLPMQLWTLRQQVAYGGPPKMTYSSMSSHYPAKEQRQQQREAVFVACNDVLSKLPAYTNEFVLADALICVALAQAIGKSRKSDVSDDTCREHLIRSLTAAFDAQVAALDSEEKQ